MKPESRMSLVWLLAKLREKTTDGLFSPSLAAACGCQAQGQKDLLPSTGPRLNVRDARTETSRSRA